MHWFWIALGAPLLWSLVNISDDYLVTKFSKGGKAIGALVIFSSIVGFMAAILMAFFVSGIFDISFADKLILMFIGAFSIVWVIFYLYALEIEDVSAVVPWFLVNPIFGYILGYIFFRETLSFKQILGSAIILVGALIISLNVSNVSPTLKKKVAVYMLISCFFFSLIGVMFKFVATTDNFWIASFWEHLGLGFIGFLILAFMPHYRRSFLDMHKSGGNKIFAVNVSSEGLTIAGNLLTNYALLIAPISLVYLVASYQPAIVLLLTFLLTKFFPNIIKEDFSWKTLWPKLLAISIMIMGSMVLFI